MTDQPSPKAAARILAERDPVIARLLAETRTPKLARPVESHFATLVRGDDALSERASRDAANTLTG
jgi:hypothetical protein